jgi:serine/threonine protein kinase/dipeptidyl aminopeptidase/acylaminoacyl peptidase
MGEVYRARDSRLNRHVAVKVLPASLSSDPDRLRRFQQEATAAAALNDPGILVVYDVGTQDGLPYVVSELLEGEALRDRVRSGTLSRRRSVEYGIQIARALAAAHDKAIVHRDLKPENVFVTREGRIKILDFGLAKLMRQDEAAAAAARKAGDATLTVDTTPGMVLGTVGYMSPEQVRGLPADARSDIFALGAMLYEMLSGQRAFKGQTPADTMSAILKEDPPELAEVGREISPALDRIVRHCLEKNPEERFRSAHDVAFALENISQSSQLQAAIASSPRVSQLPRLRPLLLIVFLFLLAGGAFLVWRGAHQTSLPTFRRLTFERGIVLSARFAPDGRSIIYAASWESKPVRLFSTPYDSPQPRPLEMNSASLLGISRSGEMALGIGGKMTSHLVMRDATLARAPVAGGAPREILEQVRAADWGPDGTVAVVHYVNGRSRVEYPVGKVLYETGGWISHMRISPAGDRIAFMYHPAWPDDRGFVSIVDLAGNETNLTQEWEAEEGLAWSPKGDEIWFTATSSGTDRALFAVTPSGKLRGVLRIPGGLTLHDVASNGRALLSFDDDVVGMRGAHDNGSERELSWLGWTVTEAITPDGKSVLFSEEGEPTGSTYFVAMRSFDGSVPTVLGEGHAYGVSPDGKWASATRADAKPEITLLPIGPGQQKKVEVSDLQVAGRSGFFPDGKRLIVNGAERGHAHRTYAVDIATGKPTAITPEGVVSQVLSSDGAELAAQDLTGSITVYSLQGKPARTIPSTAGMVPLEWSVDTRFLFTTIPDEVPGRVFRVNAITGRQELIRRLVPSDSGGVYSLWNIHFTPDGRTYAYSYRQTLSRLYVAEGLH